jgi:hypothetical protein
MFILNCSCTWPTSVASLPCCRRHSDSIWGLAAGGTGSVTRALRAQSRQSPLGRAPHPLAHEARQHHEVLIELRGGVTAQATGTASELQRGELLPLRTARSFPDHPGTLAQLHTPTLTFLTEISLNTLSRPDMAAWWPEGRLIKG